MTEISPATLLTNQRYTNWRARQHFPALGLDMLQVLAMKLESFRSEFTANL